MYANVEMNRKLYLYKFSVDCTQWLQPQLVSTRAHTATDCPAPAGLTPVDANQLGAVPPCTPAGQRTDCYPRTPLQPL